MQTLILEEGLSEGLIIHFINEMVVLHNLTTLTTGKVVVQNKVNIKITNPLMLKHILEKIDNSRLEFTYKESTDTIIVLD